VAGSERSRPKQTAQTLNRNDSGKKHRETEPLTRLLGANSLHKIE